MLPKFPTELSLKQPLARDLEAWTHLRDLIDTVVQENEMGLLIGMDSPAALTPLSIQRAGAGDPFAFRTRLGWTVCGPTAPEQLDMAPDSAVVLTCKGVEQDDSSALREQVRMFWKDGEATTADRDEGLELSANDKLVRKLWDSSTERDEQHYVLPIPFKDDSSRPENNWFMAKKRLESLRRRLLRDPDLGRAYEKRSRNYLRTVMQKGCPEENSSHEEERCGICRITRY